jgi:hypothetical protein
VYLSRSRAPKSLVLGCGEIDSAVCVYCCPSETSVLNSSFTCTLYRRVDSDPFQQNRLRRKTGHWKRGSGMGMWLEEVHGGSTSLREGSMYNFSLSNYTPIVASVSDFE